MDKELRILILEDVPTDAELMKRELRQAGIEFSSRRVETKEAFLKELEDFAPDLILADYKLPSFDGLSALAIAQEKYPDIPFLFISGTVGEELAIETLKRGATDYVLKQRLSRLGPAVNRALREVEERTKRKRTEEALRIERERLETVTQNMGAGLAFISKDYRTLWANKVLKQIFGDVEGKVCYSTYNQRKEICPDCGVRNIFEKGSEKVVHEQTGKDIEGNTIWSEIIATPIKDGDGNITAALELVIPITEKKNLEAQLLHAQKMEAIGQLAGGIAHDFNNALTLIKACSQLTLFDLKEGDPLREKIEMILDATNRSADLAHRLLAFSRRQVMEMRVLDLNNLLKDLNKMLRRVIGEDIELVNVLAEDLGRVKADPGQIEQVVLNLALNAKDAMPRGGKLTIETANVKLDEMYSQTHTDVIPGRYVMLAVMDTGVGMTPEVKNRIFEPFFTTKEKGKGTGLGLAMVYGIVRQSGGNI